MRRCSPWFLLLLELSCAALLWGRSLPCAGHVCRCRRPVECGNLLYVWKSPTAGWQQLGERHRVDHCRQARPIYGQKTGAELHTALLSSLAHTDLHHDWPRQGRQGTRKGRRQAPPQGSPRQHPGHHQARHPSSGIINILNLAAAAHTPQPRAPPLLALLFREQREPTATRVTHRCGAPSNRQHAAPPLPHQAGRCQTLA